MSSAMKKLKLLHHITAATTTTTTTTLPPAQAPLHNTLPTPPTSPSYLHHHYQRFQLLRPHTLSAQSPPPPPPPAPKYQLPVGFVVLTPAAAAASESTNLQGLCVPASPPMAIPRSSTPQQQQPHQLQRQQSIYSSRPPVSQHHQRRPKFPQRLTSEAVSRIGKDSRLARWERVLGYVREQRKNTLTSSITTVTTASCSAIETPTTPSRSWKHSVQERKRRLEELEMIETKNRMLDLIDREEMDRRSLWSGGSAGTNGVDEFVWSEDEEDDVLPMPQAPPPIKVIPEEGLFEMEETTKPTTTGAGMFVWGQRIVEEMPMLCRDVELEGGLGRLVGRRMSAAY